MQYVHYMGYVCIFRYVWITPFFSLAGKKRWFGPKRTSLAFWDLRLSGTLTSAGCQMPTQLLYVSFSVAPYRKKDGKSHGLGKMGRSLNYHREQNRLDVEKFNLLPVKIELDTELDSEMQRHFPLYWNQQRPPWGSFRPPLTETAGTTGQPHFLVTGGLSPGEGRGKKGESWTSSSFHRSLSMA